MSGATQTTEKEKGTTLHVPINAELRRKLDKMRSDDRRTANDFVRLVLEDEWTRRTNGAKP